MLQEPIWIHDRLAREIHTSQIARHGGEDGLRDEVLLQSALARPRNLFAYGRDTVDLAQLAAGYLFGIVRNHPFVDGNKRTGLVACGVFMRLNGHRLSAPLEQLYTFTMAVANGDLNEELIAKWVKQYVRPL